jgi:hypothetical protein
MLGETRCQDVHWIPAAQNTDQWWRLVNAATNIQVSYSSEKRLFRLVIVFNQ